jgi:hypothetical protein
MEVLISNIINMVEWNNLATSEILDNNSEWISLECSHLWKISMVIMAEKTIIMTTIMVKKVMLIQTEKEKKRKKKPI